MDRMLSEYGMKLYTYGLQTLEITGRLTPANQKKLFQACRDADLWMELQRENQVLYEKTLPTLFPSPAWTRLLKVDKQINRITMKLLSNARLYGWTPLGRSIILRCAAMPKNRMDDPLEGILVQNEQRMRPIIITIDPMEEVLSAYERE